MDNCGEEQTLGNGPLIAEQPAVMEASPCHDGDAGNCEPLHDSHASGENEKLGEGDGDRDGDGDGDGDGMEMELVSLSRI